MLTLSLIPAASDMTIDSEIDEVRDNFERNWKSGEIPNVAEFLSRVPVTVRISLLKELIPVDVEYRLKHGHPMNDGEYQNLGNDEMNLVAEEIRKLKDSVPLNSSCRETSMSNAFQEKQNSEAIPELRSEVPPHTGYSEDPRVTEKTLIEQDPDGTITLEFSDTAESTSESPAASVVDLTTTELGNYQIIRELGKGGMGQVYVAEHKTMKRLVALKVLSANAVGNEQAVRRFQREVEAAARLSHPNIVTAFDAGHDNDRCFLVTELIEGSDLAAIVGKFGPYSIEDSLSIIRQAALGLQYAHGCGVIHRDIKPANLLIDQTGTVRILDMGLARFEDEQNLLESTTSLTGAGVLLGSVDYMPPEQAVDPRTADCRSDIYSLGCTFFFLITGRPIVSGATVMMRLLAHQNDPAPLLPKCRASIQSVFARMIAKQPADRFQSIDALLAAIDASHENDAKFSSSQREDAVPVLPQPAEHTYRKKLKVNRKFRAVRYLLFSCILCIAVLPCLRIRWPKTDNSPTVYLAQWDLFLFFTEVSTAMKRAAEITKERLDQFRAEITN